MSEFLPLTEKKKKKPHTLERDNNLFFSPKLIHQQPQDVYEHEAERIADKVIERLDSNKPLLSDVKESDQELEEDFIQEKHTTEENIQLSSLVEEKVKGENSILSDSSTLIHTNSSATILSSPLFSNSSNGMEEKEIIEDEANEEISNALESPSQELEPHLKMKMEVAFEKDFSDVKIHNNQEAAQSADQINAAAYAYKNHIIFGEGQYEPHTRSGKKLIAHELTHTLQDRGDLISKSENEEAELETVASIPDRLIISDGETPELGQLTKTQFINLLYDQVCNVLRDSLVTRGFDENNCPRLTLLFGLLRWRTASQFNSLIREYEPRASEARSALDYLTIITDRIRLSAQSWIRTGEIIDLPEALQSEANRVFSILPRTPQLKSRSEISERPLTFENLTLKDGGRPLDSGLKMRMESAFREDFSEVKIHDDSEAHQKTVQLNARAFTLGNDIVFGESQYKPGTPIGDVLIAHELAHIIQQRNGVVNNASQINSDYIQLETDADQAATGVLLNLYLKTRAGIHEWASNVKPTLQTGLKVQACSGPIHTYNDLTQAQKDLLMQHARDHVDIEFSPEASNDIYYTGVNYEAHVTYPEDDTLYNQTSSDNPFGFVPFVSYIDIDRLVGSSDRHMHHDTASPANEGEVAEFNIETAGNYCLHIDIRVAPGAPVICIFRHITVHSIDELIAPAAITQIREIDESLNVQEAVVDANGQSHTSTRRATIMDRFISYEAGMSRILNQARTDHIAADSITAWFAANEKMILVESEQRTVNGVSSTLSDEAKLRIRRFYGLYRNDVRGFDHTQNYGGGRGITRTENDYFRSEDYDTRLRELSNATWPTLINSYLVTTYGFCSYIASLIRDSEQSSSLLAYSGLTRNLGSMMMSHPNAIPIPAVFYPKVQNNNPSTTQTIEPQKYNLQFYIYKTGSEGNYIWHLLDATNPSNPPLETEETGGTSLAPPRTLFTELDDASRFPLGFLYWKLPYTLMDHHEIVHPLTLSQGLQYAGIALSIAAIPLTMGQSSYATFVLMAGTAIGAAGTIAGMAERSNLGVLDGRSMAVDLISLAASLATLGTLRAGQIISAARNLSVVAGGAATVAEAAQVATASGALRTAMLADRIYKPLAGFTLAADLVSLGVFSVDMIEQIKAINSNTGMSDASKSDAYRRLALQGLLTGGLSLLAVHGDAGDFRMGRRIYLELAPGDRIVARLIMNDADLISRAATHGNRAELQAILTQLDRSTSGVELAHHLRGEISAALNTGVTEVEIRALITDLNAAGTNTTLISELIERFRQQRTASLGGVGASGSYDIGNTRTIDNEAFHRSVQRDFSPTSASRSQHSTYTLTYTRASTYTMSIRNPTAGGAAIPVEVSIRMVDFSAPTSTAGIASHAVDSGPARFSLRIENGRWVGNIEVNQHITQTDLNRALRHEMNEMSDIVQQLDGSARGLTPEQIQTRIAEQQSGALMTPSPITGTTAPVLRAHDRAAIEELQELVDEVNRGVAGSQFKLRNRLREVGLFRPSSGATGSGSRYRSMHQDIDFRINALDAAGMHPSDLGTLQYELSQLFGISTFPRAEFIARYGEGMRFNFETGRWFSMETSGRTTIRQFFTVVEMGDTNLAFARLTQRPTSGSSAAMSSFVPFYEMLVNPPGAAVGTSIVSGQRIRERFNALIAGPNGNDLDFVRHQLKSDFRADIVTYLTDRHRLELKYPNSTFTQATHQELITTTKGINSSDKGNIAEDWYRAAYAPTAIQHVRFTDSTGANRFPDLFHGDGTLHDLKYIAEVLSPRELAQFTEYRNMIGQNIRYTNEAGASTSVNVTNLKYSFINPDGVLANSSWMHTILSPASSAHISFEIFDRMGRNYLVTSVGIFRSPNTTTAIFPLDTLLDASAMRSLIAGISATP